MEVGKRRRVGPFGTAAAHLDEVEIDRRQVEHALDIVQGNAWVRAVFQVVSDTVLHRGLSFVSGAKPLAPRPFLQQLLDRHWVPFARDVLLHVFALGVVPVRLVALSATELAAIGAPEGTAVPRVVHGRYSMRMRYNAASERYVFAVYREDESATGGGAFGGAGVLRHDTRVRVLDGFGYDPSPGGRLRSVVASLMQWEFMVRDMQQQLVVSERTRANPVLWLERAQDDSSQLAGEDSGASGHTVEVLLGDRDRVHERVEDRIFIDRVSEAELGRDQMVHRAQALASGGRVDPTLLPVLMRVRPGWRIANRTVPESGRAFERYHEQWQDLVAAAFGVPASTMFRIAAKGGHEAHTPVFNRAMQRWRDQLGAVLTEQYRAIYAAQDVDEVLRRKRGADWVDQYAGAPERATSDYLPDATRIVIPCAPDLDIQQLLTMHAANIVRFETLVDQARRSAGMEPADADELRELKRAEQRRIAQEQPTSSGTPHDKNA